MTAYVGLNIDGGHFGRAREIEGQIRDFPQILECHAVSGEHDYLLKVVARDLKSLSQFLTDRLMQVAGVDDVRSMICLEEIKASSALPVGLRRQQQLITAPITDVRLSPEIRVRPGMTIYRSSKVDHAVRNYLFGRLTRNSSSSCRT